MNITSAPRAGIRRIGAKGMAAVYSKRLAAAAIRWDQLKFNWFSQELADRIKRTHGIPRWHKSV
jgi:hypothetical protein